MKLKYLSRTQQIAVLMFAAVGSAHAADAETGTAADGSVQNAATVAPVVMEAQTADCAFGMCKAARFDEPKPATVVGSDVMPDFSSRALNVGAETKAGC